MPSTQWVPAKARAQLDEPKRYGEFVLIERFVRFPGQRMDKPCPGTQELSSPANEQEI
jgi:hypothetical protein